MADQLRNKQRQKANINVRGPHSIGEMRWNETAGADKVLPVAGRFKKPYLGAINTAKQVTGGAGGTVAVFNNSASVAFVATGVDNTITVSSADNGIPVPAYSYAYISMGQDTWIIGSAATMFGYELDDDTYIQ